MSEFASIVHMHITGEPGAVDRLIENLEAAELPWLQVQDVSDATLLMGQARRHLTALVPLRPPPPPPPPPPPARILSHTRPPSGFGRRGGPRGFF